MKLFSIFYKEEQWYSNCRHNDIQYKGIIVDTSSISKYPGNPMNQDSSQAIKWRPCPDNRPHDLLGKIISGTCPIYWEGYSVEDAYAAHKGIQHDWGVPGKEYSRKKGSDKRVGNDDGRLSPDGIR